MINFIILGKVLKSSLLFLHLMQIDAYIAFGHSIQSKYEPKQSNGDFFMSSAVSVWKKIV